MATLIVVENLDALTQIKRFSDPDASGDYSLDCKIGRDLADELVADMADSGFGGTLPHIVRDLVETGTFGPVQIGFFHRIAEHALR